MKNQFFFSLTTAFVALALFVLISCGTMGDGGGNGGNPSSNSGGSAQTTFTDTRDNKVYKIVVIGTQTWMAENLNYDASGSKCYDNLSSNCNTYGRLYDWSTAMGFSSSCNDNYCSSQIQSPHRGICPVGWHIPSNADWDKLYRYADGTSGTSSPYESPTAGRYLKSTSGWYNNGNGTNQYGFSALPGGNGKGDGFSDGSFGEVESHGNWWSASELEDDNYGAFSRYMYYDDDYAYWDDYYKSVLQSVRCVQD